MAYLATSATPGMSGFSAGRIRPQPLMGVHSALLDKSLVPVKVQLGDQVIVDRSYETTGTAVTTARCYEPIEPFGMDDGGELVEVILEKLAYARSGDKGDNANIGVIARKPEYLPVLAEQLTAQAVDDYMAHLERHGVEATVDKIESFGITQINIFDPDGNHIRIDLMDA